MPLPSIQTVSNFWNTGPRYRPSGAGQTGTTNPANNTRGGGSYSSSTVTPTQTTGGSYPLNQSTQQGTAVDPYSYFSGNSPYGNYAQQVAQGYDPSQLPRLMIPSLQTWARMGPQFQQQYYGYKQAQTGAIPEQSYWNIMRLAPPSGQGTQLSYRR